MKKHKGGVAFFDSGIGGLTVLAACRKHLPDTTFYYYGDNFHAPYGNLSAKQIRRYTQKAFRKFQRLNVDAAVVACNTVTTVCIDDLRKRFSFPIIGTEPAVHAAAKKGGVIFVLTTRATFESEKFRRLCQKMQKLYPQATISPFPCDGLAGEIEQRLGSLNYDFTHFLPRGTPDLVVLGCTHYIYIKEVVKKFYDCEVIDGNEGVAARLASVLKNLSKLSGVGSFFSKDREARPHLTTNEYAEGGGSVIQTVKEVKLPKNALKYENIFFLGKAQVVNKTRYEQMFVHF